MERPSDWSALGLGGDPTPGDPVIVRDGGFHYREIAAQARRAHDTLTLLEAGASAGSKSVSALLENSLEIAAQLLTVSTRYQAAGDALVDYSFMLDQVQATTIQALNSARYAQEDVDDNHRQADMYARLAEELVSEEQAEERSYYLRLEANRREEADDARIRVATQRELVAQAIVDRDTAANIAISRIEGVTAGDGLNDTWWDDWGAKLVAFLTDIAEVISAIAGILALLALFIPILGPALAGVLTIIAAVTAIVGALGNIALAATGERSWTAAVISIVGAVLACVGLGALKGSFGALKGALGGFKAAGGVKGFGGIAGLGKATLGNLTSALMTGMAKAAMRIVPSLRAMTGKTVLKGPLSDFIKTQALRRTTKLLDPIEGFHDVFCHGEPTGVLGELGQNVSASELADLIRATGSWDGVESIRLVSCQTGSGPFAQELADALGVPVLAPLKDVWSSGSGANLMESARKIADMVMRYPQ